MAYSLEEYQAQDGWSSQCFINEAEPFIRDLMLAGVKVTIHRTVIHLRSRHAKIKAYVHYNGRSSEWATITDWGGGELASFHYTEFELLRKHVLKLLSCDVTIG